MMPETKASQKVAKKRTAVVRSAQRAATPNNLRGLSRPQRARAQRRAGINTKRITPNL